MSIILTSVLEGVLEGGLVDSILGRGVVMVPMVDFMVLLNNAVADTIQLLVLSEKECLGDRCVGNISICSDAIRAVYSSSSRVSMEFIPPIRTSSTTMAAFLPLMKWLILPPNCFLIFFESSLFSFSCSNLFFEKLAVAGGVFSAEEAIGLPLLPLPLDTEAPDAFNGGEVAEGVPADDAPKLLAESVGLLRVVAGRDVNLRGSPKFTWVPCVLLIFQVSMNVSSMNEITKFK